MRTPEESLRVDPEHYERGIELPPVMLDPEDVYGDAAVAADRPPDFDAVAPEGIPTVGASADASATSVFPEPDLG